MALLCNGTSSYGRVTDTTTLNTITHALSAMAWVRPNATPTTLRNIIARYGETEYLYQLGSDETGVARFSTAPTGKNSREIIGGPMLTSGRWFHVAGTYDDSVNGLRLFIDGTLIISATENRSFVMNSNYLTIGAGLQAANGGAFRFWNGAISDARLYNRALSSNEIQTIAALMGRDLIIDGLVFRYLLNEGASGPVTTLRDLSGPTPVDGSTVDSPTYTDGLPTFTRSAINRHLLR